MKLLFDDNLSPKLVKRVADLSPGLTHVFDTGLGAIHSGLHYMGVCRSESADSDFVQLSQERGFPPKVIRIDRCTFRTAEVEELIRRNAVRIAEFEHWNLALPILREIT